jgi:hypothetical protein
VAGFKQAGVPTMVKFFGYSLAASALTTSLAMLIFGGRFQRVEAAAYSGPHRPWWFWLTSLSLMGFYLAAVRSFLREAKSWAGWVLMVLIPVGWASKAALVTFNPRGRQWVTSLSGDMAWRKAGLARLPIAAMLAALASRA